MIQKKKYAQKERERVREKMIARKKKNVSLNSWQT